MRCSLVEKGRVGQARARKIDGVLRLFGATLVTYSDPRGQDPRVWVESRNLGSPFDEQNDRDMREALTKAGLYPLVAVRK